MTVETNAPTCTMDTMISPGDALHPQSEWLFQPPPALADCVCHGLIKNLPGGPYLLPAGLQPIFLLVLDGGIRFLHGDRQQQMARLNLCGGTQGPRQAWAAPGTRILTLSVKPGQLRRLIDMPAATIVDCRSPLDTLLRGEDLGELARCETALAVTRDPSQQVAAFFRLLFSLRRRRAGLDADLHLPIDLLATAPGELADRFGISQRQFERRFLASYGQSLRSFRQQLRCSRLIAACICGQRRIDSWAGLAAEAGYFDQPHLHHDLQRFTGHTPGQLAAGLARDDPAFWPYRIASTRMGQLFGPSGY